MVLLMINAIYAILILDLLKINAILILDMLVVVSA